MTYAIILAGGIGSRFWPLSTALTPKQFLRLCSDKPLFAETIERVSALADKDNMFIATNKIYKKQIFDCIKEFSIPSRNFLFEPSPKNTFLPIGALAGMIFDKDKEAVAAVFPSDHFIRNEKRFLKTLKKAAKEASGGNIITLGISPKKPDTGFGYIRIKDSFGVKRDCYEVDRFVEKPDLKTARELIKDKRYYWNGGIFVFKARVLLEEIERFYPQLYRILRGPSAKKELNKRWQELPAVSIDYAIMEKTKRLKLIPLDCGWSDLGSWQAIEDVRKKDKRRNIFRCDYKNIDLESQNTFVWSESRPVVTLGLKDVIIADTKEGLLVCSKDKTQEVKRAVELLGKKREA